MLTINGLQLGYNVFIVPFGEKYRRQVERDYLNKLEERTNLSHCLPFMEASDSGYILLYRFRKEFI